MQRDWNPKGGGQTVLQSANLAVVHAERYVDACPLVC